MKRITLIAVAALLLAVALPAVAGSSKAAKADAPESKCSQPAQSCLDYMVENMKTRGWVGVELDVDESGALTIMMVEPGSPAKKAGLQQGDLLTAMNGIRFSEDNKEAMKAAQAKMTIGATVTYSVQRGNKDMDVDVELGAIPDAVMAKWIGRHMLDHASVAIAKN